MKKYRGETIETENNLRRAHKIHLLIHPGFASNRGEIFNDEKFQAVGNAQLVKYLHQAVKMRESPDELLFAFVPGSKLNSKLDHISLKPDTRSGKTYLIVLRVMKAILGPRMIAIKDELGASSRTIAETDLATNNELKIFNSLKALSAVRGYTFDEQTFLEAYGEYLESCVEVGAHNFERAGKFVNPVKINSDLSLKRSSI